MLSRINGTTELFGIIGHPVKHSLSPQMHNACINALKLNSVFIPFDVKPEKLGDAITGIRALNIKGVNVTIPHKSAVIAYLDRLDQSAVLAGAVNVIKNENGFLTGYNSDGDGLLKSLHDDLSFVADGSKIVMLGAGGAASGALPALCRAGASELLIVNRSVEKAEQLSAFMMQHYPETAIKAVSYNEDITSCLAGADLLLNTTSLGMNAESFDCIDLALLPKNGVVYDMIYAPPITPLLAEASRLGLRHANGLGMLAAQGELAFKIWNGIMPPPALMKSAISENN